jgi:hypothetical protein
MTRILVLGAVALPFCGIVMINMVALSTGAANTPFS